MPWLSAVITKMRQVAAKATDLILKDAPCAEPGFIAS